MGICCRSGAMKKEGSSGGVHWKSTIRNLHTKILRRKQAKNIKDDQDYYNLWTELQNKHFPLSALDLIAKDGSERFDKEGWLLKRGGMKKGLTSRYFVLSGTFLYYFTDDKRTSRCKGIVPLFKATVEAIELSDAEKAKLKSKGVAKAGEKTKTVLEPKFCLKISTKVREYLLSADTEVSRNQWVDLLKKNSSLVLPSTAPQVSDTEERIQSIDFLQKLLLPPKALEAEIGFVSYKNRKTSETGKTPTAADTSSAEPKETSSESKPDSPATDKKKSKDDWVNGFAGGQIGDWEYKDGLLRTITLTTDGSWPFKEEGKGLNINCQYTWDGEEIMAKEGTGSKGEWDGKCITWYALPLGEYCGVYQYRWIEDEQVWQPEDSMEELPKWNYVDGEAITPDNKVKFNEVAIKGSVPPIIALVVAMHKWQWEMEELATIEMEREAEAEEEEGKEEAEE